VNLEMRNGSSSRSPSPSRELTITRFLYVRQDGHHMKSACCSAFGKRMGSYFLASTMWPFQSPGSPMQHEPNISFRLLTCTIKDPLFLPPPSLATFSLLFFVPCVVTMQAFIYLRLLYTCLPILRTRFEQSNPVEELSISMFQTPPRPRSKTNG
jgi:hypothetical protein